MTIKTENFNPETDPKLLCTCGDSECDKRSVKQNVLHRLQRVRDQVGRPLYITSGGRCSNHPNEKHRAIPADHQKGQAVDVRVNNGLERAELVSIGLQCGFNAIGVAKTFVHLGVRPGAQLVMWTY